jgi:hypothetical protein
MYFLCFVKGEDFFLPTRKLHYSDLAVTACLPPPPPPPTPSSQFELKYFYAQNKLEKTTGKGKSFIKKQERGMISSSTRTGNRKIRNTSV